MNTPIWKKSIVAVALASTAVVGVAGVAAAAPNASSVPTTSQHKADTPMLPKELRQSQGDEPSAQVAGQKSVKLRVINHTDAPVTVTDHGANDARWVLRPGGQYDVSGWGFWAGHPDVTADIQYDGGFKVPVWGYNPWVGYPSVGVDHSWDRYDVGESHVKTTGVGFTVTVTRQADEDMKLFTLEVKNNQ